MLVAMMGLALSASAQAPAFEPPTPSTPTGPIPFVPGKGQAPAVPEDSNLLAAEASIAFEKTDIDLGKIFDSGPVNMEFKFTNNGPGPLRITNVHASCGCTAAELQKREYAAGESGIIKATFDPKGKSGQQQKTITVDSNDRSKPKITLNFKSEITPLVKAEPNYVSIDGARRGQVATKLVRVTGLMENFEVTKAVLQTGNTLFDCRVLETRTIDLPDGKVRQTDIEVSIKPGAPIGRHNGLLALTTNDTRMPTVSVGVGAVVTGDLLLTPERLMLGVVQPGAAFGGEVKLSHREGKPFKITGTELKALTPGVTLDMKVEVVEAAGVHSIKISGTAPAGQLRYMGELAVSTNMPGEEAMKIPVSLTVFVRQPGNVPTGIQLKPGPLEKGIPAGGVPGAGSGVVPPAKTPAGPAPK
jgi:hypothetical protein